MKYRAEIDGLRALAVLPVILFHAGFELFRGGFVGVDIFFVISGYLITTILINDIENKRFSIVQFYERRARRILPALFFVMICCVPFAWMWLLHVQMKDFSQSLIAVSLFSSNFLFWLESGYFDTDAEEKPLLHTWSLAVEEQYYLLFPIFLILAWRFGRNRVFWTIIILACISLLLSEWGWRNRPTGNFYTAPTRAWELFAGSIAAFIIQKRGAYHNNFLAFSGLVAVLASIFFYDESIPFPSVYSLLPVGGVFLIILFSAKNTFVAKILSTRILVGIGLVSYSAYLWHQPLFAFARARSLGEPEVYLMLILSGLSIALAVFSWRFIEQPFRANASLKFKRGHIFAFSGAGFAAFLIIGVMGQLTNGFGFRLPIPDVSMSWTDHDACHIFFDEENSTHLSSLSDSIEACLPAPEKPDFLLIGDSHAQSLSKSFRMVIEVQGGEVVSLNHPGCLVIEGTTRLHESDTCRDFKKMVWSQALSREATIILATRWRLNFTGIPYDNGEGGVEKIEHGKNYTADDYDRDIFSHTKEKIITLSEKNKVIIISQLPEAGWHVPKYILMNWRKGQRDTPASTSFDVFKKRNKEVHSWLSELDLRQNIDVVWTEDLVCDEETGRCLNELDGIPLYHDDDHPSLYFTNMIARQLAPFVKNSESKRIVRWREDDDDKAALAVSKL